MNDKRQPQQQQQGKDKDKPMTTRDFEELMQEGTHIYKKVHGRTRQIK